MALLAVLGSACSASTSAAVADDALGQVEGSQPQLPIPSWIWQPMTVERFQEVCSGLGLGAPKPRLIGDDYWCTTSPNSLSPYPTPILTEPLKSSLVVGSWRPYFIRVVAMRSSEAGSPAQYRAADFQQYQPLGQVSPLDVLNAFREKYGDDGLQRCTADSPTQDMSDWAGCLDSNVLYIPERHVDGHMVYREYSIWYLRQAVDELFSLVVKVDTVRRFIGMKVGPRLTRLDEMRRAQETDAIKSRL